MIREKIYSRVRYNFFNENVALSGCAISSFKLLMINNHFSPYFGRKLDLSPRVNHCRTTC